MPSVEYHVISRCPRAFLSLQLRDRKSESENHIPSLNFSSSPSVDLTKELTPMTWEFSFGGNRLRSVVGRLLSQAGEGGREPRKRAHNPAVWGHENLASRKSKGGPEKVPAVWCSQPCKGFFLGALLLTHGVSRSRGLPRVWELVTQQQAAPVLLTDSVHLLKSLKRKSRTALFLGSTRWWAFTSVHASLPSSGTERPKPEGLQELDSVQF